jgi:hypothetical protein
MPHTMLPLQPSAVKWQDGLFHGPRVIPFSDHQSEPTAIP